MGGNNPVQVVGNSSPSRLQLVLDQRIRQAKGRSLERYLADRRHVGLSWTDITYEIRGITDRPVSHETLRRWAVEWGIE